MPYKKRLHARFPPVGFYLFINLIFNEIGNKLIDSIKKARIKKIMQMDEEVGKVSSPVPVMVCILF
jgi:hypothetical protein